MKTKTSAPAVYVGTWAKYNNGSIEGCWFNDLTVFETESDFLAAARKFHKDEKDPEFMYQDYENFPSGHGFLIPVIPVSNSSGGRGLVVLMTVNSSSPRSTWMNAVFCQRYLILLHAILIMRLLRAICSWNWILSTDTFSIGNSQP